MNTLIASGVPLILVPRASDPSIDRRSSTISPGAACNSSRPSFGKKTWRLQAQAKGFGKVTIPERKDDTLANNNNPNEDDNDDKISAEIWDRMLVRILFYVGVPMVSGVVLLYVFGVLKDNKIWDVPRWVPFLTTLVAFGTSTIGIAYGTLSTNLDPEKPGSLLGWEEAQQNWPELWKEENDDKRR